MLDQFLRKAEQCGVRAFHLAVDPGKAYAKWDEKGKSYHEELQALRAGLSRMEFKFSPRSDCGHARYLLGNYSGMQFDHGFDVEALNLEPKRRKLNHVHWLTEEVIGRLHQQYGWT